MAWSHLPRSCNLTLLDAVEASNTIPLVSSPKLIDGELFVDGGISNTMPGDVLKEQFPGIVVGVNVAAVRGISIDARYDHFPSSWEILYNLIKPTASRYKVPFISEILNRSVVVGNKRKLAEVKKQIDFLIEPDLSRFGAQNHSKADQIIEAGYQAALPVCRELLKVE